jgi:aerobic-type carbon monoxide dehydrogenase small subunit (CoxS/CutS family)
VRGERVAPLAEFFTGVRTTVMAPDEMLVDIAVPAMRANQRGMFIKLGLRGVQAISVVNAAVVLTLEDSSPGLVRSGCVLEAAITLGAVAPTIIHAGEAETFLVRRILDQATISQAAELAKRASRPIDDIRGSAAYRSEMVRVCIARSLDALANGKEREGFPEQPVLLWGKVRNGVQKKQPESAMQYPGSPIVTRVNGKTYTFTSGHNKTLLRLLREEAGLTGTKEGCGEGECGACTVFLDGKAVMSCLTPAARADGAEIATIEGLAGDISSIETDFIDTGIVDASGTQLHPVQRAFIEVGAVQCGYCTPGFIMSAVKLLEEQPQPSREAIKQSISGNLCRCTGYYRIVQAIEKASQMEELHGQIQ